MTPQQIKANKPDGATHYGYDGDDIVYLTHVPILGYWNGNYYLDDYEVYLFNIKPI